MHLDGESVVCVCVYGGCVCVVESLFFVCGRGFHFTLTLSAAGIVAVKRNSIP